jgi:hypothetical protein
MCLKIKSVDAAIQSHPIRYSMGQLFIEFVLGLPLEDTKKFVLTSTDCIDVDKRFAQSIEWIFLTLGFFTCLMEPASDEGGRWRFLLSFPHDVGTGR